MKVTIRARARGKVAFSVRLSARVRVRVRGYKGCSASRLRGWRHRNRPQAVRTAGSARNLVRVSVSVSASVSVSVRVR